MSVISQQGQTPNNKQMVCQNKESRACVPNNNKNKKHFLAIHAITTIFAA